MVRLGFCSSFPAEPVVVSATEVTEATCAFNESPTGMIAIAKKNFLNIVMILIVIKWVQPRTLPEVHLGCTFFIFIYTCFSVGVSFISPL